MVSELYPRTLKIERASHQEGEGAISYGGLTKPARTLVQDGVPASVQAKGNSRTNPSGLPGDTVPATWHIFIPRNTVADGVIRDRDLVTDDLGRAFAVTADYVNRLGWRLVCDRLE